MKAKIRFSAFLLFFAVCHLLVGQNSKIVFVENKGQVSDQSNRPRKDILFVATDSKLNYYFKKSGFSYQVSKVLEEKEQKKSESIAYKLAEKILVHRIDVDWLGANPFPVIEKGTSLPGTDNYYLESCPDGVTGVRSFTDILFKEIYGGVDLHYFDHEGKLKYDYIVKAGADYKKIKYKIRGADKIYLNRHGALIIETPIGKIVEHVPVVRQEGSQPIAKWVLQDSIVSFNINGLNSTGTFTIDPLIRLWGTYYGGPQVEWGMATVTDNANDVYLCGFSQSPTSSIIATVGSHQTIFGGNQDGFISKFNAAGIRLWSTYYGGAGMDDFCSASIDLANNLYVTGSTNSSLAISTAGSHQSAFNGISDAYLVKFNSAGVRQWGTYYGGYKQDQAKCCATDVFGNVFLTGETFSDTTANVIATAGCHQQTFGGYLFNNPWNDGFLVKFNSAGARQWGTYYGGNTTDYTRGCATDLLGNIYICGATGSATGIATPSAFQPTLAGSMFNGYLAKFDAGGVRQWGTYYGNGTTCSFERCVTDNSNNIYLLGEAVSPAGANVTTAGAHQAVFGGGNQDALLVKFDPAGIRSWATYYGGPGDEWGRRCAVDNSKNIYIAGNALDNSAGTFTAPGCFQSTIAGGTDAYLAKFDSSGVRTMATLYGGSLTESGEGLWVANNYAIYMCGLTGSSGGTVIASPGAHQTVYGGGPTGDAYFVKFFDCGAPLTSTINSNNGCFGMANGSATMNVTGGIGYSYSWTPSGGTGSVALNLGAGVYTCVATSTCGNSSSATVIITPPAAALSSTVSCSAYTICSGSNASLTVISSGGTSPYTYSWSVGGTGSLVTINPTVTSNYSVISTDANGCFTTNTIVVNLFPVSTISIDATPSIICPGEITAITANGANTYTWSNGNTNATQTISPSITTGYTVTGTDGNGCESTASITIQVVPCTGFKSLIAYANNFAVYPNPGAGDFVIVSDEEKNIVLTNNIGQLLFEGKIKEGKNEFHFNHLENGVYFLQVKGNKTVKLVVMN
jgi:hypothetical protein